MFAQQIGYQSTKSGGIERLVQNGQTTRLGIPQPVRSRIPGNQQGRNVDIEFVAQHLDNLDAILRTPQPVVRYDEIGKAIDGGQLAHHLRAGTGCNDVTLPFAQQRRHAFLHSGFVIDHQDQRVRQIERRGLGAAFGREEVLLAPARQRDREHRAFVDSGTQLHAITQQPGQAFDDGEPETKPLTTVAFRIVELVELVEHLVVPVGGNALAGIPHFDANLVAFTPNTQHDSTRIRVSHCVGEQIANQTGEQRRIALHEQRRLHYLEGQALLTGDGTVLEANLVEDGGERDSCYVRLDHPRVESRDVQEGVEQFLHRINRPADVADDLTLACRQRRLLERLDEQAERMQGLAQIVAGSGEESRLGNVRILRGVLLLTQLADQAQVLEPQVDGFVDQPVNAQRKGCHQRQVHEHQHAGYDMQRVVLAQKQDRGQQDARIKICKE